MLLLTIALVPALTPIASPLITEILAVIVTSPRTLTAMPPAPRAEIVPRLSIDALPLAATAVPFAPVAVTKLLLAIVASAVAETPNRTPVIVPVFAVTFTVVALISMESAPMPVIVPELLTVTVVASTPCPCRPLVIVPALSRLSVDAVMPLKPEIVAPPALETVTFPALRPVAPGPSIVPKLVRMPPDPVSMPKDGP